MRFAATAFVFAFALVASAAPASAFVDQDRDGRPPGVGTGTDCDDRDPTVWKGAPDPKSDTDSFDQNCDHAVDADGDKYSISTGTQGTTTDGDCNDNDPTINYGTNTCDSFARPDIDGDGYLRPFVTGDALFNFGADCNDGRADVHPGAAEIPGNGVDEDCDGAGLNIVRNGSFEGSSTGWTGTGASLALQSSGGAVGPGAMRATVSGSATTYGLYSSDRPIRYSTADEVYLAFAWIRTSAPTGETVTLRVREYTSSGSTVKTVTTTAKLAGSWTKIGPVAFTAARTGSSVEVRVTQSGAESGDSFDVDEVTLTRAKLNAPNLISNGDFEGSVQGWKTSSASIAQTSGGIVGPGAARVSLTGSSTTYTISTSPRPVTATAAGETFLAWAWARSSAPAGEKLYVRVREYSSSGSLLKTVTSSLTLGASWARANPVAYSALAAGSSIDIAVYQTSAESGDTFDADGIRLVRVTS